MGDLSTGQMFGLGTSAMSGVAKYKTDSAQYQVDKANQSLNNQRAQEALTSSYRALEAEADQIDQGAISTSIDQQRVSAVAKGDALAVSGASGMGGTGSDMSERDVSIEGSRNLAKATMNRDRELTQNASKVDSAYNTFLGRVNLMPTQKPSKGAQLINSGVSGFRNVLAIGDLERSLDSASRTAPKKSTNTVTTSWQSRQQAGIY